VPGGGTRVAYTGTSIAGAGGVSLGAADAGVSAGGAGSAAATTGSGGVAGGGTADAAGLGAVGTRATLRTGCVGAARGAGATSTAADSVGAGMVTLRTLSTCAAAAGSSGSTHDGASVNSNNQCSASTAAPASTKNSQRRERLAGRTDNCGTMKLATFKDGSRDGQLVVVSRDLTTAHFATGIATRLQQVLDDWNFLSPQLQDLYVTLNQGKARHAFEFVPSLCMAPLPRACQWADGSAYINHVELVRKSRKSEVPESFYSDPLMYQGGSDDLLGPCDDAPFASADWGIDFEAEIAVITGDVPSGVTPDQALEGIRLVMLANDWSLRHLIPNELAKGFGFFQSKPATAFSPVAVTPDELGDAWQGGRVHLPMHVSWNGKKVGMCDAGPEMTFHFGQLIAHLCKTRRAHAGSIIGSGTVSNKDWSKGYSCIAEKRCIETIEDGAPKTPFMAYGDTVRIEMKTQDGLSVFGAIEQKVVPVR
jgi:fumarylacetoacetate (FAA) hydrolase